MASLKELWAVETPKEGPGATTDQGKKFVDDFKVPMARAGDSLQYTASYADKAAHDALAGRRDGLMSQFQAALKKIDPATPAKAEADIDKTMKAAEQVADDAATLKQQTEEAVAKWEALAPQIDEADNRIAEMQGWGSPEADLPASQVTEVRNFVNDRKYGDACVDGENLLVNLEPIYQAYQEQRAAQERYEAALAELQPRLDDALQSEFASLAAPQEEVTAMQATMTAAADARDYKQAEQIVSDLTSRVDGLLAARDDLQAKRKAYEEALAALEPRLPTSSQMGGTSLLALQDEINALVTTMREAAAADDYDTALSTLREIEPKLAALETQLQARDRYEEQRAGLQLPESYCEAAPLVEMERQIESLRQQMEDAAAAGDYEMALSHLTELELVLSEYTEARAQLEEQRQAYEAARAALEPHLPTSSTGESGRIGELEQEVEQSLADADVAATAGDYESGLELLRDLEGKLEELDTLLIQSDEFKRRWAALKPRLPTTSEAAPAVVVELQQKVETARGPIDAAATAADYEQGLTLLDDLETLLAEFEQARDTFEQQRQDFEDRYGSQRERVQTAIEMEHEAPEVKALQTELAQQKQAVEAAATALDFVAGMEQLATLEHTMASFDEELRKVPRSCLWLVAAAGDLQAAITQKYLNASNKVLDAADAYDAALAEYKAAIDQVDSAKQLVADFLIGVFFAGLGGAAGGAVGARVTSALAGPLFKEITSAATKGAIVDATKDVAKFTTRFIQEFRGSPGDPAAGISGVGGSGVELTRNLMRALNKQGEALLQEVRRLNQLVMENEKTCAVGPIARVEGTPAQAIENDPLLQALGQIATATKKTFAQLLWGAWIETFAYSTKQECLPDDLPSQRVCYETVDSSNVDGFFAWWGDLVANIRAQAGDDFGLNERLATARRQVQEQINARENP